MNKRLPPYSRKLVIPLIPYIMIFVGEPECWQHCKDQQKEGFYNHLCLPDIDTVDNYQWPINGLSVVAILFSDYSPEQCIQFVQVIGSYEPKEIAVRNWGEKSVISFREEAA